MPVVEPGPVTSVIGYPKVGPPSPWRLDRPRAREGWLSGYKILPGRELRRASPGPALLVINKPIVQVRDLWWVVGGMTE